MKEYKVKLFVNWFIAPFNIKSDSLILYKYYKTENKDNLKSIVQKEFHGRLSIIGIEELN